ncbi:MAG: DUF3920 family protein [Candidatus Spechtbacterales bacterium]
MKDAPDYVMTGHDDPDLFELSEHPYILLGHFGFAKKFVSKERLIEYIEKFFEEEGFPLCKERRVAILFRKSKVWGRASHTFREDEGNAFAWGDIVVFVKSIKDERDFLETLFHELTHTLQGFEGIKIDYSKDYEERTCEIQAEEKAISWCFKILARN